MSKTNNRRWLIGAAIKLLFEEFGSFLRSAFKSKDITTSYFVVKYLREFLKKV